jgi:Cytochrome P460
MTTASRSKLMRNTGLLVAMPFLAVMGLALSFGDSELIPRRDAAPAAAQGLRSVPQKPGFNAKGALIRPEGYREWIYIGTPLTPNDLNPPKSPFHEFHNVYIHPSDYDHWKKTGTFPDATVLVAESVSVGSKSATSGKGYFMGEFEGLETAVKDSVRFKDEPGYWAYFTFGQRYPLTDNAEKLPPAMCNICHRVNAADDFVFTQYYPVLRGASKMGINVPK